MAPFAVGSLDAGCNKGETELGGLLGHLGHFRPFPFRLPASRTQPAYYLAPALSVVCGLCLVFVLSLACLCFVPCNVGNFDIALFILSLFYSSLLSFSLVSAIVCLCLVLTCPVLLRACLVLCCLVLSRLVLSGLLWSCVVLGVVWDHFGLSWGSFGIILGCLGVVLGVLKGLGKVLGGS